MNSTLKSLLFWIVLIGVGIMIWSFSAGWQRQPAPISFTDFLQEVKEGQVHSVVITGNQITGKRNGVPGNAAEFRTYAPAQYEKLANELDLKGVKIEAKPETTSPWANVLYSWAPILLMIGFWIFIMRQMQSGGNKALSFGKSRAKLSSSSQKKVTFKDVSGVDELGNTYADFATADVKVIDPAIRLEKSVSDTMVPRGSEVTYEFRVTNVGTSPLAVAEAAGSAWITSDFDGDLWRVDP